MTNKIKNGVFIHHFQEIGCDLSRPTPAGCDLLPRSRRDQVRCQAMKIWVDADACPTAIKAILYRAANRAQVELTLVANQMLRTPPSPWIRALQVPAGFDGADQRIVQEALAGDLVITADVPLAAKVIAKGACALDPRGDRLDASNIQGRLSMRNFMEELRSSGVETGGPAVFSAADRQAFANRLDGFLSKRR